MRYLILLLPLTAWGADYSPEKDPNLTHYDPVTQSVTMPAKLYEGMIYMLEAQRQALRERPVEEVIKRRALEIAKTLGCS